MQDYRLAASFIQAYPKLPKPLERLLMRSITDQYFDFRLKTGGDNVVRAALCQVVNNIVKRCYT